MVTPALLSQYPPPTKVTLLPSKGNLMTLQFTVYQEQLLKMPEHAGSMLRGAFGVALRSLTCVTGLDQCRLCPLKAHCKFPLIFESHALSRDDMKAVQAVNPYVIHTPASFEQVTNGEASLYRRPPAYQAGDTWHFGMTLMGQAMGESMLIIKAWQHALQTGLGSHTPYSKATLIEVTELDNIAPIDSLKPAVAKSVPTESNALAESLTEDDLLYSLARTLLAQDDDKAVTTQSLAPSEPSAVLDPIINNPLVSNTEQGQLTLRFLTPFRYQQNNQIIYRPERLDSVALVASLYNRIQLCQLNHASDTPWQLGYDNYHDFRADIASLEVQADVYANHVPRRSNRQQRKMELYGLQGDIHLSGAAQILQRLLPALILGQRLHIGKNTTMGLGQYQLLLNDSLSIA
ncbi:CRISPR system precrRNA processing endoribonuclease RAMP protein Cas6 [Psychrobacter arenosus]|uniref:CRISPR system precrRNA processing endoribonuclease RAMP protein Cas6 n=1 Tax=Psychrobacter arenosus TaxID=256326 RepID=UPI00191A8C7F|nr:CRISPR system precrRNA processing endoribonuclease RAMP protein Cas6 [Psychrobacter arenosus]